MPVLVVDVGNSRTKFAVCETPDGLLPPIEQFHAVDNSTAPAIVESLVAFVEPHDVAASVVAGSETELRDQLVDAWPDRVPPPLVVRSHKQIPVTTKLDSPETVGVDRLLNALGARTLLPNAHTIVIVDAGTATTVDLVIEDAFCGGAILPGLRLAAMSLHDYTAALPLVDTGKLSFEHTKVPGANTLDAIGSGIFLAQIGAIREIISRYESSRKDVELVFTGGTAERLMPAFKSAQICPYLSLGAMAMLTIRD